MSKVVINPCSLKIKETQNPLPELGHLRIADITPQMCRNVQTKNKNTPTVRGTPRAASTVNNMMATLSKIFTLAIQENKIDRNPVSTISKLEEPPPRNRILTNDEKLRFWNEISKDVILFRLVTIAIHTGLRRGQILAIRIEDLDFDQYLLHAIKSKGRAPRYIPLNKTMRDLFQEIRKETSSGDIFPFKSFKRRWKTALRKASIEDFRFHDLKHAFATALFNAGVPRDRIELLFAHSSPAITNRYLHPEIESGFDAVNLLDEIEVIEKTQ